MRRRVFLVKERRLKKAENEQLHLQAPNKGVLRRRFINLALQKQHVKLSRRVYRSRIQRYIVKEKLYYVDCKL